MGRDRADQRARFHACTSLFPKSVTVVIGLGTRLDVPKRTRLEMASFATDSSQAVLNLVPRPLNRAWYPLFAHEQTPHFFCGASETSVIWSVFHDRTLLKHAGRYIPVENDGGQFRENCVCTSRVVRPQ